MSTPFLTALGQTSLSAAVMVLAVVILRLRFQRKTPQRVFCLLWDIVLVRLVVLAEITSPLSIQRLLTGIGSGGKTAAAYEQAVAQVTLVEDTLVWKTERTVQDCALASGTAGIRLDWPAVLTALWLLGLLACGMWLLWGHLRSRALYAASLPVRSNAVLDWQAMHPIRRPVQVRCSDRIASPLTYGIFYPVVLLPAGMDLTDTETLGCVLAHEYTHIRRFDTLRKGLLALALCLHWFNPLVWTMYVLANRDVELACDEAVVRSGADRRSYALALLRLEEERSQGFLSGSSFSRNALEERIQAIMKIRKLSLTALIAVLVVMSIATTVFAAAAPEDKPTVQSGNKVHSYTEVVEDSIISRLDENGSTIYSADGGKTWMSEEKFHAKYGDWGDEWTIEWWTADEYAAWLEQEKKDLQEIIGERAYTGGDGWFVWDQEKVNETIALYESILEDINNGVLHSKTIWDKDGNIVDDVALGSTGFITTSDEDMITAAIQSTENMEIEREAFHRGEPTGGQGDANFDPDLIACAKPANRIQSTIVDAEVEIPSYMEQMMAESETVMLDLLYGNREAGKTFEEIFYFADRKPDGSVFSHENPFSADGSSLYTIYDENGILTGLTADQITA